jgi:hypothetical protein
MKSILKALVCSVCVLFLFNHYAVGQVNEPSYVLTPLKAKYVDSTNPHEIILVFKHYSKSREIEKLIISGKLTYSLGDNGKETTDILGKSTNQHAVTVFGTDMMQKGKHIYDLVKDSPEYTTEGNVRFIVFTLRNLTDKYIDKMTFTYGLWEPLDQRVRFETKYQLQVEK